MKLIANKFPLLGLGVFWVLSVFLCSCGSIDNRAIDQKEVAQEIRDRKPKYITEKDLLKWVNIKGQAISFAVQKDLYRQVKKALADEKIKSNAAFAELPRLAVADSLAKAYQVAIESYSFAHTYKPEGDLGNIFLQYKNEEITEAQVKSFPKTNQILYTTSIVLDNETVGIWAITFTRKAAFRFFERKELKE
jgi:hypothetical protein